MNLDSARDILRGAIDTFNPTHIVSMVSGGRDSAASDQVARELGVKIDMVIHGNTRCGIPETNKFVRDHYGKLGDFVEADAGTAYEDYVLSKGFFGMGVKGHGIAYRELKAVPFRRAISRNIRKGKWGIRVLLLTGARKAESISRKKRLEPWKPEPGRLSNIWVNPILHWSDEERDEYLRTRQVTINPVAVQLCRSGECMCGTMQTKIQRAEAAALFPEWGRWLDSLEAEVKAIHGYSWGTPGPTVIHGQGELFEPMCTDCKRVI